jgi:hypothetical protein
VRVHDGRHRANSRTELDAARERAEQLVRKLEANRARTISAEAELAEAIEVVETLRARGRLAGPTAAG